MQLTRPKFELDSTIWRCWYTLPTRLVSVYSRVCIKWTIFKSNKYISHTRQLNLTFYTLIAALSVSSRYWIAIPFFWTLLRIPLFAFDRLATLWHRPVLLNELGWKGKNLRICLFWWKKRGNTIRHVCLGLWKWNQIRRRRMKDSFKKITKKENNMQSCLLKERESCFMRKH